MPYRYEEIAEALQARITARRLLPGQQLPTEAELASEYAVGMPTIRHALELLQDKGMVDKRHGVGTFVRPQLPRITYTGGRHQDARLAEIAMHIRVLSAQVPASRELAALLRVPERTALAEFAYLSSHNAVPYSLAHVYVPRDAIELSPPIGSWSPWGDDIRLRLIESGLRLASTEERVTARTPTPEEAHSLQLPARASVLAIDRRSTDEAGRVLEGTRLVLPGDRNQAVFSTTATSEPREKADHG